MKSCIRIIFLLTSTIISTHNFSQGKIDRSKDDIKNGGKKESNQEEQSCSSSKFDDKSSVDNCGDYFHIVEKGAVFIGYILFGNYKTENHLHSSVTNYPFYNGRSGNYESIDSSSSNNHFRFDIDNGFLYSNQNLLGNHFKFNIRPLQYFYLQAQYHQLTERNVFNKSYSNLSLFNFNFCYDRLRLEQFDLGWKLGMCFVANGVNRAGFSFGLNTNIFLLKPISISVSKQWSSINKVPVNQFEVGGKLHKKRYSINLGYEHLKIGSPEYDFMSLGAGVYF
jgi:hypothetical protein